MEEDLTGSASVTAAESIRIVTASQQQDKSGSSSSSSSANNSSNEDLELITREQLEEIAAKTHRMIVREYPIGTGDSPKSAANILSSINSNNFANNTNLSTYGATQQQQQQATGQNNNMTMSMATGNGKTGPYQHFLSQLGPISYEMPGN